MPGLRLRSCVSLGALGPQATWHIAVFFHAPRLTSPLCPHPSPTVCASPSPELFVDMSHRLLLRANRLASCLFVTTVPTSSAFTPGDELSVKSSASRGEKVFQGMAEVAQPYTVYVFTGQGSQEPGTGMCTTLHPRCPCFWEGADLYLLAVYGFSIVEIVQDQQWEREDFRSCQWMFFNLNTS
ncbi:hypothetical protein EW146_g2233 [Bondarzewia mesenterica]|uniref:Uncharacterized protein n=1 Tax=Bondarzewia mesenterica TaxID=1095465 RepID=A0A4S4M189_9AGAM|nr:hypothetical protein EW146_g2233 [Bondarzewia mesenterica]